MTPGATALTMTPLRASSRPRVLVSEIRPALEAAYAVASGQPVTPHSEEISTIRPKPARSMPGRTACTRWKAPPRLVSTTFHQSSGSWSTSRAIVMYA